MMHSRIFLKVCSLWLMLIFSAGIYVHPVAAADLLLQTYSQTMDFEILEGQKNKAATVPNVDVDGFVMEDYYKRFSKEVEQGLRFKVLDLSKSYDDSLDAWPKTDMAALRKTSQYQDILKNLKAICPKCDVAPPPFDVVPPGVVGTICPSPAPAPRPLYSCFKQEPRCDEGWGYDYRHKQCREFAK